MKDGSESSARIHIPKDTKRTVMTRILVKGGTVVHPNDDAHEPGTSDVLIQDDKVLQVGQELDAQDAEVIDASGLVLMPGMADTHTHLWESLFKGRVSEAWGMEYFVNIPPLGSFVKPEDVYAGVLAGALELVNAGVTSVVDYCHCILTPEHADAAIEALRHSGIRALFGYDLAGRDPSGMGTLGPSVERFEDVERVRAELAGPGALVRLGVCLSGVSRETLSGTAAEIQFARELGVPMSYHNNKGGEISLLDEAGLLGNDLLPAHCNYTTDEDLDRLAAVGGYISTQPEAETYSGRRPMSMVSRAHRRGVKVALGVDVPALVNPGIMTQMRFLYFLQRYLDGVSERTEGHVPIARRPGIPCLEVRDVLRFGTVNGVESMGLGGAVGRIAPGFQADIVAVSTRDFGVAEGDPAAHVVLNSDAGNIDMVMIAGRIHKRDGHLVDVELGRIVQERVNARDRVVEAASQHGVGEVVSKHWDWVPTSCE